MKTFFSKATRHLVACLVLGAFTAAPASLRAANVTVTTTADELNGNTASIAALIGTPGGAGISLREAIIAANNTAGADTILFNAATNGTPCYSPRRSPRAD